ncbi:hypothetical protein HCU40_11365 [Pseudanabaena biceps]|nr:hypothetical protein [Pseudanabaena biceps]
MNICSSCKKDNPNTYQFCQFCGTKIVINISTDISTDISADLPEVEEPDILENIVFSTSSTPTQPFDLQKNLGEIKIQVQELAIAQSYNREINEANHVEELLEPLNSTSIPEDISSSDLVGNLEMSVATSSTGKIQHISYAGKTDMGRQRDLNEDDFAMIFQTRSIVGKSQISDRSNRGVFILCDGMGGHDSGEIASAIAVNSIVEQFLPFWVDTIPGQQKLKEIIGKANQEIFFKNENDSRQELNRMGTTLALVALHDANLVVAHVGDSRVYRVTANAQEPQLEQLTRDHAVFNQLIDHGFEAEVALARPDAYQLTQALGPNSTSLLEPTINFYTLTERTLFLLCSDGLCDNNIVEDHWRSHLLPIFNQEIDMQIGLDNLIELGNQMNGHDNLTAILILCVP